MIKPTIFTWIMAIFGAVTFLPLMLAKSFMLIRANDQKTKDLIIGIPCCDSNSVRNGLGANLLIGLR